MSDTLSYLYHSVISPHDIKMLRYDQFKVSLYAKRNFRGNEADMFRLIKTCNDVYLSSYQEGDIDNYALIDPFDVWMEILCFFSSIGVSFDTLKGKKVLSIGANYGIEIILLRAFGVDAYGIEKQDQAYTLSGKLAAVCVAQGMSIPSNVFIHEDMVVYETLHQETYDYIIGRNINPLADVGAMIRGIGTVLLPEGIALLQWDAIYKESEAIDLYAPKKEIYYNEALRSLLDNLYKYSFHKKKPRGRFLYKISH